MTVPVMLADLITVLEGANTVFPIVVAGVFGAVFASFLGVVSERVPRHESLLGRSHCVCGRQLDNNENVPIVGWLANKGKTPCCNKPIPKRYLLSEVGLALWFALSFALFAWPVATTACIVGCLVVVGIMWQRPEKTNADVPG